MYLRISVVLGAKKESVQKLSENKWLISAKQPAEQNLANNRVCTLIARELHVTPAQVRTLTGHCNRVKMIAVDIT